MPWQVGGYATEGEKPFDQGSFGTVWKAHRLSDDAPVANAFTSARYIRLTDGPDEVHMAQLGKLKIAEFNDGRPAR